MNRFQLSTFLTPIAICCVPAPALAATTVSTATTTPLLTSSAGDVTVASGGSITVPSGPAVTADSNNKVTVASGGTLTANSANGSGGILAQAGTNSAIENDGSISAVENYTVTPVTGTSTASGPIADTTGRYGILVNGAASGSITNTGTISVKGLSSVGIGTVGTYTGTITNSGTIGVKGDGSVGISTQAVDGSVVAGGTVTAVGQGAQDIVTQGDISGSLSVQGSVSQATSYTADDGTSQVLSAAALRSGAAAVEVDGNVAQGVVIFNPCTVATLSGVNSCTVTNSAVTTAGSIASVGNSPALQIGGTQDITIGAGATSIDGGTYSLVVDGTASGTAGYSTTDAYGVVIGGRGGAVNLPGGIGVTGTIGATSQDSTATALLINAGSTVQSLTNSGTIRASLSQAGGTAAYGVRDLSGTLTNIVNHGAITATAGVTSAAIDVSANTSGVNITQSLSAYQQAEQTQAEAASTYNAATATVYNSITGDILTGSGNDVIAIQSGNVTGNAWLGGGADQVQLSGNGKWVGDLHFGTGTGTITLGDTSSLTGAIYAADQPVSLIIGGSASYSGTATSGASQLAVTVNGGSFGANSATNLQVASLTVNSGGALKAFVDGSTGTSSLIQAGTATFASGAKVSATISSLANATGTYEILAAGTLAGNPQFDATTTSLPVLFDGSVAVQGNDLYLTISRKTAAELGLNASETAGYDAIYANAAVNTALATSLLQVADTTALKGQMDELLPDSAGGVFDFVTRTSRLVTRHITDDSSIFPKVDSNVGGWFEPVYFHASKAASGTAPWTDHGFGLSTGLERKTGIGYIGGSFAWMSGGVDDGNWQTLKANDYEVAAFWRLSRGPFYAFAKAAADFTSIDSTRTFTGSQNSTTLTYKATGHWSGFTASANAGTSYKLALGDRFSLKPMAVFDWFRLHEGGYTEGGDSAIDLTVDARNSTAASVATTLSASWSLGQANEDTRPLTFEIEGGRRNHLWGNLGATTATFANGTPFTITPDSIKGSWLEEARVLFGGFDYTWQLTGDAEQIAGRTNYSARATLSVAL